MARNPVIDVLPEALICTVPIYHYTSAAGLLGIVDNHSLWATEAFGLNDVSELRHGWRFVNKWLASQVVDEVIEEMQQHVEGDTDRYMSVEVFMCCASTLPDDASQWRLYADNARGYSIEIDPRVDLGVVARVSAPPTAKRPKDGKAVDIGALFREHAEVSPWLRVMYTDDEKVLALSALHAKLSDSLKACRAQMRKAVSEEEYEELRTNWQGGVRAGLSTLAQCMKAESFRGESEVRAVGTLFIDTHCYFRATPYGIVRYINLITSPDEASPYKVVVGNSSRLPIKSVCLGPAQIAQNSIGATSSALNRHGYDDVRVVESRATLR